MLPQGALMLTACTTQLHSFFVFLHFSPYFALSSITLEALSIVFYMDSLSLNCLWAMSWWSFRKRKKSRGGRYGTPEWTPQFSKCSMMGNKLQASWGSHVSVFNNRNSQSWDCLGSLVNIQQWELTDRWMNSTKCFSSNYWHNIRWSRCCIAYTLKQ